MADERPPIGPELERQVRQKCGFACVMCGCPIYDYDHIDNWADVQEHKLDNLTLLCTLHHRLKNKGILAKEIVRKRTENIRHKPNGGLPDINFSTCKLILGDNEFIGKPMIALLVYERDYFYIYYDKDLNQVVIYVEFFDNEGNTLFKIEDNVYTHSVEMWDVETRGNLIIIREGFRKRLLVIKLDTINNTIIIYGKLFCSDNKFLDITKNGLKIGNDTYSNLVSNNRIVGCDVGLMVSDWSEFRPHECGVSIGNNSKNIVISDGQYVRTNYGIALDTQGW